MQAYAAKGRSSKSIACSALCWLWNGCASQADSQNTRPGVRSSLSEGGAAWASFTAAKQWNWVDKQPGSQTGP